MAKYKTEPAITGLEYRERIEKLGEPEAFCSLAGITSRTLRNRFSGARAVSTESMLALEMIEQRAANSDACSADY